MQCSLSSGEALRAYRVGRVDDGDKGLRRAQQLFHVVVVFARLGLGSFKSSIIINIVIIMIIMAAVVVVGDGWIGGGDWALPFIGKVWFDLVCALYYYATGAAVVVVAPAAAAVD